MPSWIGTSKAADENGIGVAAAATVLVVSGAVIIGAARKPVSGAVRDLRAPEPRAVVEEVSRS